MLLALVHADLEQAQSRSAHVWGPIGRFGWKFRDSETNPLKDILAEAERQKESWGPLNAGLFGGSYTRFEKIAAEYAKLISSLNWF